MLLKFKSSAPYLASLSLLALACGGADKPAPAEPADEEALSEANQALALSQTRRSRSPMESQEVDDGMEVEGLRGRLHPEDIKDAVEPRQDQISECFNDTWARNPIAGGELVLSFRVGRQGQVKSVFIEKSSVGSWAVESCLLGEARRLKFVKPTGGDAYFKLPLTFPSQEQATWLAGGIPAAELETLAPPLEACSPRPAQGATLTLYLKKEGTVDDVGFSSQDVIADAWSQCVYNMVREWQVQAPLMSMVKTSLRYPLE